jgi:RNA polymerase subunit RPABC4/transcription elongation factor Spt4
MPPKAVKATKEIIDSPEQGKYQPEELSDNFKGRIIVLNPEQSEIAKALKINKKGNFAVKT